MGVCRPDSRGGDGAEAFLPGRVPDLQLHLLPVDLHGPNLEIHSDCGDVAACSTHTLAWPTGCPSDVSSPAQVTRPPQSLPTHFVPSTFEVPGTQP